MNYADIKDLIQIVSSSEVTEVEVELEGVRIKISKHASQPHLPAIITAPNCSQDGNQASLDASLQPKRAAVEENKNIIEILSPMVGTFYSAPTPSSSPFVTEGDKVSQGQSLCIIEAMKLMNEIESEYQGKLIQSLVENGQPVEYGQPLFLLELVE